MFLSHRMMIDQGFGGRSSTLPPHAAAWQKEIWGSFHVLQMHYMILHAWSCMTMIYESGFVMVCAGNSLNGDVHMYIYIHTIIYIYVYYIIYIYVIIYNIHIIYTYRWYSDIDIESVIVVCMCTTYCCFFIAHPLFMFESSRMPSEISGIYMASGNVKIILSRFSMK